MNIGFSHTQRHSLALQQSVRLTQAVRLRHRLQLLHAFTGERFAPRAKCPHCGYTLTAEEILRGFRPSLTDITTACPRCSRRILASLVVRGPFSTLDVGFLCSMQTLGVLCGMEDLDPEEIQRANPAAYRSALAHFGSLRVAFHRLGVRYRKELPPSDWKRRVRRFLGLYPDRMIANCVRVSAYQVAMLRKRLGKPAYRAR